MRLSSFDDLVLAARAQPERQRLLLVFAHIGLPADATPEQRASFEAGRGGALTPVMCVDKAAEDFAAFADLAADADRSGNAWSVVFVAAIGHRDGVAPSTDQVGIAMQQMIEAIGAGRPRGFALFDRDGRPVQLG
ncbi:MAG: ribonucleotide reductase subunit alpha [Burkholderiales bacterium]|nr:MAG: ribonucleotide reductase subunit alpha [Burkholderiales bacterium]